MKKNSVKDRVINEYLGRGFATFCGFLIVIITLAIIIFVASKGINAIIQSKISLTELLGSSKWTPYADNPSYGTLIFIVGSTLVSVGAVIISAPIAISLAIFMNLISPKLGKQVLQPAMELFVGIPSVVYGYIGIVAIVPFIRNSFGGVGFSLIAGIIVLSIMILPTIASISSDAIKIVPRDFIEASYALGATRWQTISRAVIPAAKGGILTGLVLGLARAFGEALAVQMVIGNSVKFAGGLFSPTSTLTSILTMDMANTFNGSPWNNALWFMAFMLMVISFVFILLIRLIGKRGEN